MNDWDNLVDWLMIYITHFDIHDIMLAAASEDSEAGHQEDQTGLGEIGVFIVDGISWSDPEGGVSRSSFFLRGHK